MNKQNSYSDNYKSEQREAIFYDGGNMLVSASAGSGKTFVMIERLINIIKSGRAEISNVLAVTFTEKAATEMKEKLKKALIKSIEQGNKELAPKLEDIPTADISTLHAFCGKLIRNYFFKVGVSPDFIIADSIKINALKNDCLDKTLREFYKKQDANFESLVDKFAKNRKDDELKSTILKLYDFYNVEANPLEFARAQVDSSQQRFESILLDYQNYLKDQLALYKEVVECSIKELKLLNYAKGQAFAEKLLVQLNNLLDLDLYQLKGYNCVLPNVSFEQKLNEQGLKIKEDLSTIKASIKNILEQFTSQLTDRQNDYKMFCACLGDVSLIIDIIESFTINYDKAKREENILDFADLEHFALKVLDDQEIRQNVQEKYKYVFVDEYQDINGVQEAIIQKITNNNLFMVGDSKQSIYGFRGCKPEIFSFRLAEMPKNGEKTVLLNYNFRSADAILDLVNTIFMYAMENPFLNMVYSNSTLKSGGIYPEDAKGRTKIHFLKVPKKKNREIEKPEVYDISTRINGQERKASNHIANLLQSIIESELGKPFYNIKEKRWMEVSLKDICILTRNREDSSVANIVKGLIERDYSVVSEVETSIFDLNHIQVLINALKLIDNFTSDIPLACTLKSCIGNFSAEDLAEMVLFFDEYKKSQLNAKANLKHTTFVHAYKHCVKCMQSQLGDRLRAFDEYFNKIRILADFCGANEILNKLIYQSNYENEVLLSNGGELKIDCLRKFMSATISGDRHLTVSEFLFFIENNREEFTLPQAIGENNLTVMTMHASKGLEFPVVIICGMENAMHQDKKNASFFSDRQYGIALKYYDLEKRTTSTNLLRGIIKEKARIEGIKEEMRLFYVATTRATYSMHLIYEGTKEAQRNRIEMANCFLDFIPKELPYETFDATQIEEEEVYRTRRPVIITQVQNEDCKKIEENLSFKYNYLQDTTLCLKSSVTKELSKNLEEQGKLHYIYDGEDCTDIERGIIAHKIMENLNFDSIDTFYQQVQQMVNCGLLSQVQVEKVNLEKIYNATQNQVFSLAKNSKLFKEQQFIANVPAKSVVGVDSKESVLVQGAVDLLIAKDDFAYIVDYKYSMLTEKSLSEKYAKQLDIYAMAIELATSKKVKGKYIVNLYSGDVVKID